MSAFRRTLTAIAGALALAAFLPPAVASGVNKADAAKLVKYVNKEGFACMGCHTVEKTKMGPAWIDVAKKYPNTPKNVAMLAKNIKDGVSGVWNLPGQMMHAMPPNSVTKAQAKKLAEMVLKLDSK